MIPTNIELLLNYFLTVFKQFSIVRFLFFLKIERYETQNWV